MYEGAEFCQICKDHPTSSQSNHGARYLVPFSPELPRFEVWNQQHTKPSAFIYYCKYLATFPCFNFHRTLPLQRTSLFVRADFLIFSAGCGAEVSVDNSGVFPSQDNVSSCFYTFFY